MNSVEFSVVVLVLLTILSNMILPQITKCLWFIICFVVLGYQACISVSRMSTSLMLSNVFKIFGIMVFIAIVMLLLMVF